jgi:hypothetical protein
MGELTSAGYHEVHLPNDLIQFDHSEAIHAAWKQRKKINKYA